MDKGSTKKIVFTTLVALLMMASVSCTPKTEPGVSITLARERKELLSDISYTLHFDIPESRDHAVLGHATISFHLNSKHVLALDFKANKNQIRHLAANGEKVPVRLHNEHITILPAALQQGYNQIEISFIAGDMSLNRSDDYLYTLLVPDRARTLFPCFDQPDLKAEYTLSLTIPVHWTAVANGREATRSMPDTNTIRIDFEPTEPLSTYLFSFVAGDFIQNKYTVEGRAISIYHRETEPRKVMQIDQVADQIFFCLAQMEAYTAIPYPFAKYDAIILPGFQYGGMEHTGATLYNDKRLILGDHPTTEEERSRAELIAHETAHMWFGDYVTMKWFDDVWTKEVFAGYFAAAMTEPLFPQTNHTLNAIKQFIPPAYAEDRTQGATAIKQPLENLQDAGLIYGKTIYNKAPIVMRMLADKMGAEPFRRGLQEYLAKYAFSNATWEELIAILDRHTSQDLISWSRVWVHEKGMPEIDWSHTDNIPNGDGKGYGFYRLDQEGLRNNLDRLPDCTDPVTRLSVLINLHEHLFRRYLQPAPFSEALLKQSLIEDHAQIFSMLLQYLQAANKIDPGLIPAFEASLWKTVRTHHNTEFRQLAFNVLLEKSATPASATELYAIWNRQANEYGLSISDNQYMTLAFELAIRYPEQADSILYVQRQRITNQDKIREFAFIAPAVSPVKRVRDSLFRSLLQAENRTVEPWAVKALRYLNHPLRQAYALEYIIPALEILPQIQRTGDIFLPANWCAALLDGHNSADAAQRLHDFLQAHQNMPVLLKNKILQAGDWLLRITGT